MARYIPEAIAANTLIATRGVKIMAGVNNELRAREVAEALNEVKFSGFHLRAISTVGMGFFTSA